MVQWINYKQLKAEMSFEDVLAHYEVRTKRKGDQVTGVCPLPGHEGDAKSPSFSANLDRNIFQCFGCGAKGNILEFIALMEGHDLRDRKAFNKAAVFAKRKFLYTPQREVPASKKKASSARKGDTKQKVIVNPALDFELQGLDDEHPYLAELGLSKKTVKHFGLGFCKRGLMKNRIAIPLIDDDGQLIGYAGLLVDDAAVDEDNPKLLLPKRRERNSVVYDFNSSLFLYHGHAIKKPAEHLVLVTGIEDVWSVWQAGRQNVVTTMGPSLSDEQADLLLAKTTASGTIWVLADGSKAGEELACDVFRRMSVERVCRWVMLPDSASPADLDTDDLHAHLATIE